MNPLIIGDVHGKYGQYWRILQETSAPSLQLGDFGFSEAHEFHLKHLDSSQHKVLFGNHDDYSYLRKPHSLGDHGFTNGIFTVRGAWSIDRAYRTEGRDWWANEELNYNEMQGAIDTYAECRPEIVITHDCPHEVRQALFGIHDKSITSSGLQVMFEQHQPALWIFGHHHKSRNEVINGTRFICLNELETYQL